MTSILTALVAIAGTLSGSLVTYLLQKRMSARAEQFAQSARLREERLSAYGEFAKAIMDYRHAEFARWEARHGQGGDRELQDARAVAHQKRAAAWHAFFTVQLLAGDAPLIGAAGNLLEITSDVHHASDEADLQHRGSLVRSELADFVALASRQLR
ncbi:hypothetical protein [Actinomadura bangladeshensis]|uniref:Protein kilB n=1 Tax=Actinomadura bangladeshensis TaxID=453573 RepID=A0A4R4NRT2_9ACTN|nr:hypothetical protein [Actinomadura bangladeshensis]TDC12049.1 hypothetical protein E1284_25515 [Actinomadura bangladeshensis]